MQSSDRVLTENGLETELNSQKEKVGMGRERDREICESIKG